MAKPFIELAVFVSSPANLMGERKVIEEAIKALNPALMDSHSVTLRTLTWEADVIPGIGADPQSVINSQIDGKYDIYIGVIGSRLGSKTPRAESGTEEEFNNACARYRQSPETMRVLFYFKKSADNIHEIDIDQLAKVKEFRKRIADAGVLYHDFSDQDELLKITREHLRKIITEQWNGSNWKVLSPSTQIEQAPSLVDVLRSKETISGNLPDSPPGILDILSVGQDASENSIQT